MKCFCCNGGARRPAYRITKSLRWLRPRLHSLAQACSVLRNVVRCTRRGTIRFRHALADLGSVLRGGGSPQAGKFNEWQWLHSFFQSLLEFCVQRGRRHAPGSGFFHLSLDEVCSAFRGRWRAAGPMASNDFLKSAFWLALARVVETPESEVPNHRYLNVCFALFGFGERAGEWLHRCLTFRDGDVRWAWEVLAASAALCSVLRSRPRCPLPLPPLPPAKGWGAFDVERLEGAHVPE